MTMPRLRIAHLILAFLLIGPASAVIADDISARDLKGVHDNFRAWQFEDARAEIARLEAIDATHPEVVYLRGKLAFFDGDYAASLTFIDQAIANAANDEDANHYRAFRALVSDTHEVSKDYAVATSPKGHFQIRYPKGKDEVLLPFAFDALDAAYEGLAEDFGVLPPTPVRVEVYPSSADLARVSSLTEEDISTSGTIALCKYNRLMITSPKALVRGYTWIDTLSHEYVHLVINLLGQGKVPIWLHEGLAKFSERRWRGEDRRMRPYSEYLLHKRASSGEIVTFDQMHPSMAKLPSQEDAAMAFAEVYAAMELIHLEHGTQGLRDIVQKVGTGTSVEGAIAEVTGKSFDRFVERWKKHMLSRDRRFTGSEPPDFYGEVAFKKDASTDDDDLATIPEEKAREHVHLGELLRARNRPKAAVIQYRKANDILGSSNPVLQAKLGRALVDSEQYEAAIAAMQPALDDGEEYVPLYVYIGEAYVALSRWEEAEAMLLEAAAINPFDPAVHAGLAKVYRARGDANRASLADAHVGLLRGS